ncbi:MAG: FlaA1/EpsC-like NDP-sugar epimerase [Saprospiraceae bacterium]|jgi:FlaA1/EpsC-like NDP-sugar epimerase
MISPRLKKTLYVVIDLALVLVSVMLSLWLLDVDVASLSQLENGILFASPALAVLVFYWQGLYDTVIRYLSFKSIFTITKSVTLFSLLLGVLLMFRTTNLSGSVAFMVWAICLLLVGASRFLRSWQFAYFGDGYGKHKDKKNILIYGAGTAGVQLATLLSYGNRYVPMGFVDDSPSLRDRVVEGHRVYALEEIQQLIDKLKIDEILLAIPSASRSRRKRILKALEPFRVHVRSLPSLEEIVNCEVSIDDIREVDMADLLGREPVPASDDLIHAPIQGKVVMITGAAGSIGSELCRQIAKLSPAAIILYEQHEYSLYKLNNELLALGVEGNLVPVLGSVLDSNRVAQIIERYKVATVFHAAAYKHVPMVEDNPTAGARNNILGTYTVAKASCDSSVENFVLVSTDKAVRPTNVMGATKRVAELVVQAMDAQCPGTRFSAVRFGNVIGSSGSVIPRFREQIKSGGPVTVTHRDITRFFMTMAEAAQLVIQAGALAKGGDVFVLDMGKPVKIDKMAKHMIRLSGLTVVDSNNPEGDIEISYIGLRPGEKLYEELLIGDSSESTEHSRILRARESSLTQSEIDKMMERLIEAVKTESNAEVLSILRSTVPEYQPAENGH